MAHAPSLLVEPSSTEPLPTATESPAAERAKPPRLVSLDLVRGITVLLMLVVNNLAVGNAAPAQLLHAPWGEMAVADLVFPWFLMCVGLSLPFSYRSSVKQGGAWWAWPVRSLRRALLMFGLGVVLTSAIAGSWVVSMGVLQLIACAYFVGALFQPLPAWARGLLAAALVAGYGAWMQFTPHPSFGTPRLFEDSNIVHWLNAAYLTPLGLRGIVSIIPTAALVLIASLASEWVTGKRPAALRFGGLLGVGGALTLLGYLWDPTLPFAKTYWTSSYILASVGLGLVLMAVAFALTDWPGWRGWTVPFAVLGSNALLAYVGPILLKVLWLGKLPEPASAPLTLLQNGLKASYGAVAGGWAYTAVYIVAIWAVLAVFYWRKWFLRV